MRVLFAVSEIAPWVKTGGLGDVAGALPRALMSAGCDVRVLVPAYPALMSALGGRRELARIEAPGGALPASTLWEAALPDGLRVLLLESTEAFTREGNPYLDAQGRDWPDNALRFGLLSRVAALCLGAGLADRLDRAGAPLQRLAVRARAGLSALPARGRAVRPR